MIKPKMILFDYGQTLINEVKFDGVKGTEAVLKYAVKNKYNKTAEEVQDYANQLNKEIGRFDPEKRHLFQYEIPNHMFTRYLYESQGIEIDLSPEEIDNVFWDAVIRHALEIGDFFHKPIEALKVKILLTGSLEDEMFPKSHCEKLFEEICSRTEFAQAHIFERGNHPAMMSNMDEFVVLCRTFNRSFFSDV